MLFVTVIKYAFEYYSRLLDKFEIFVLLVRADTHKPSIITFKTKQNSLKKKLRACNFNINISISINENQSVAQPFFVWCSIVFIEISNQGRNKLDINYVCCIA